MMKLRLWFQVGLTLAATLLVQKSLASAKDGSHAGKTVQLTAPGTNEQSKDVVLVPYYYTDDGTEDPEVGVMYYKVTLTRGKAYVFWLTDNRHVTADGDETILEISDYNDEYYNYESPINSYLESGSFGSLSYAWLGTGLPGDENTWDEDDTSSSYTFCLCVEGGLPGDTATLHYRQTDLLSALPAGVIEEKPEELSVSQEGAVSRDGFLDDGVMLYHYFKVSLEAGKYYHFSSTPATNETVIAYEVEWLTGGRSVERSGVNDQTGESWMTIRADEACTARVKVSVYPEGSVPEQINLSWRPVPSGFVGAEVASQTVSEDAGSVAVTLTRTGSDLPARVKWMTVGETATPGEDYVPTSGVVRWTSGDVTPKTIVVPVLPDAHPTAEGGETFCIRLELFPEEEIGRDATLGEDEVRPTLSTALDRITIADAGTHPPEVRMIEAEDEPEDQPLAVGSFEGVLLGGTGSVTTDGVWSVASVTVTSEVSGAQTARVEANGQVFVLTGRQGVLTGVCTVKGMEFASEMRLELPSGLVSDLAEAPVLAEASVSVMIEKDGEAVPVDWDGVLYRASSRRASPVLERMRRFVGRYTVGLGNPAPGLGDPAGDGYLMLEVSTDLTVRVEGALPDGTTLAAWKTWAEETKEGFAVPLAWSDGVRTFGGTLSLTGSDDGLAKASSEALVWRDDRPVFGGDGESGLSVVLEAFGGTYDTTANLGALYNGWVLTAWEAASPFAGLEIRAVGADGLATDADVALSFDRARGLVSGQATDCAFSGVLLTTGDDRALAGRMTAAGEASVFEMFAEWLDPDWSERWGAMTTTQFNLGGATGTTPAGLTLELGLKLPLPVYDGTAFSRPGYEFMGWRSSSNHGLYPSGTVIPVPAEDTVFTAEWTLSVEGFAEALDCADLGLKFATGETVGWFPQTATTHDGTSALQSGDVAKGTSTYVEATVTGSGELSFWWKFNGAKGTKDPFFGKVTSEPDALTFTLDGQDVQTATEAFGWTQVVAQLGEGTHTLRWTFARRSENSTASNAAWVDELSFGVTYPVVFDPGAGEVTSGEATVYRRKGVAIGAFPEVALAGMVCTGWVERVSGTAAEPGTPVPEGGMTLDALWAPTPVYLTFAGGAGATDEPFKRSGYKGDKVKLPACSFKRAGYSFCGWKLDGSSTVYSAGEFFEIGADDVSFTAQWTLSVEGFAEALDCADLGLRFATGETVGWFPQTATTHDGSSALQSGDVAKGGSTYAETTVTGPGELSFWWKSNGEAAGKTDFWSGKPAYAADKVTFLLDGEVIGTLEATTDWKSLSVRLEEGTHQLRWIFQKNGSKAAGAQYYACLDQLSFAPDQVDYSVSWPTESGITRVWTVIGGVTNEVANGAVMKVEPGAVVLLDAAADDWRVVNGLGSTTVTTATNVALTAAIMTAADILTSADTPAAIKQALGLTTTAFDGATDAEGLQNLAKVVGWAQRCGCSPAQVNALAFDADGNPTTELSEAYLLNVAEDGVAAAKANFAFTSFDSANPPTSADFADKGYNGAVQILQSVSPAGPWSVSEVLATDCLFYRARLVK